MLTVAVCVVGVAFQERGRCRQHTKSSCVFLSVCGKSRFLCVLKSEHGRLFMRVFQLHYNETAAAADFFFFFKEEKSPYVWRNASAVGGN